MRTLTDQQNLEINCGGWALGKDIWYEPYEKELIQEELYTGLVQKIPYKIMREYVLQLTFDKIHLDNYANFICESSYAHLYEQAKEHGYVGVAYRIGLENYDLEKIDDYSDIDWDFHFRRYTLQDGWTEKIGVYAPRQVKTIFDWSDVCDIKYTSSTKLFLLKN